MTCNCCAPATTASVTEANACLNNNTQRVCIEVKKVYDAALSQQQLENVIITVPPIVGTGTFVSLKSTTSQGGLRNVTITPIKDMPGCVRVQADVDIPVEVRYKDGASDEYVVETSITVSKDIVMHVPDRSVIPYELDAIVSAVSSSGVFISNTQISVIVCVTIILKIIAEVILMVPAYGYCTIPMEAKFDTSTCGQFFSLPLFPPTSC